MNDMENLLELGERLRQYQERIQQLEIDIADYNQLRAEAESRNDDLVRLVDQFDAAIRRTATELTDKACGGVDTGNEINPETGEPYGHGGHTGWLLAEEARKLKSEITQSQREIERVRGELREAESNAEEQANIAIRFLRRAESAEAQLTSLQAALQKARKINNENAFEALESYKRIESDFYELQAKYAVIIDCIKREMAEQQNAHILVNAAKILASTPQSVLNLLAVLEAADTVAANDHPENITRLRNAIRNYRTWTGGGG